MPTENFMERFSVLDGCNGYFNRIVKEALQIKRLKPKLNIQQIKGKQSYSLNLF